MASIDANLDPYAQERYCEAPWDCLKGCNRAGDLTQIVDAWAGLILCAGQSD